MTRSVSWRLPLIMLLVCVLAGAATARVEENLPIEVEGEDFVAFNDLGGMMINIAICGAASGALLVDNLDVTGEWIEVLVPFAESGFYQVSAGFQGWAGSDYDIRITMIGAGPGGEDLRAETAFVGAGIG